MKQRAGNDNVQRVTIFTRKLNNHFVIHFIGFRKIVEIFREMRSLAVTKKNQPSFHRKGDRGHCLVNCAILTSAALTAINQSPSPDR